MKRMNDDEAGGPMMGGGGDGASSVMSGFSSGGAGDFIDPEEEQELNASFGDLSFDHNLGGDSSNSSALLPREDADDDDEFEFDFDDVRSVESSSSSSSSSPDVPLNVHETFPADTDEEEKGPGDDDDQSKCSLDQILAKEMNRLTVAERTQAIEDVHGVSGTLEVDETTKQLKLKELADYIKKHKSKEYKLAEKLSRNYVQNEDFRLQFLQADLMNVSAAGSRLFKFLHYKLKLFGRDKLVHKIKQSDLNPADMTCLNEGTLQVLLQKDSSGRPVFAIFQHLSSNKNDDSMLRVTYYMYMSLLDSFPEVRQTGFVFIFYNTHPRPNYSSPKLVWRGLKLRQALPVRTISLHVCTAGSHRSQKSIFRPILSLWQRMTKSYLRARVRRHHGDDVECRAQLQAFGIPMVCFPVNNDGEMNFRYHQEWIRRRRAMEVVDEGIALVNSSTVAPAGTSATKTDTSMIEEYHHGLSLEGDTNNRIHEPPILPIASKTAGREGRDLMNQAPVFPMAVQPIINPTSFMMETMQQHQVGPSPSATNTPRAVSVSTAAPTSSLLSSKLEETISLSSPASTPPAVSTRKKSPTRTYSPNDIITQPTSNDILFGRGKPMRNHPGNVRFRNLLEAHLDKYNRAPKFEKGMIAKRLVQTLTETGSRFLKPKPGSATPITNESIKNISLPSAIVRTPSSLPAPEWVMVDEKTAETKVSQYFRSRRGPKHQPQSFMNKAA